MASTAATVNQGSPTHLALLTAAVLSSIAVSLSFRRERTWQPASRFLETRIVPYTTYKLVHFFGIFLLIVALAASSMNALRGGNRSEWPWRKALGAAHGVSAFLILLGGFGMLARLGVMHDDALPGWVIGKLGIWFTLAAAIMVPRFGPQYAKALMVALPVLALSAGALALLKPF